MILTCSSRYIRSAMSATSSVINRLEQRARQADDMIARLKNQLNEMKRSAAMSTGNEAGLLKTENLELQAEVQRALRKLVALETSHGTIQIPCPQSHSNQSIKDGLGLEASIVNIQNLEPPEKAESAEEPARSPPKAAAEKKAGKAEKKATKAKPSVPALPSDEPDITQVDLRIGRIVDVKRHPDADTLYVEQVDVGEESPRTVVSGLVRHVVLEEMQNRLVILCCNLKPAKMRGVISQAMVMCAAKEDKIEILLPPEGVTPGERVGCEGYDLGNYPSQMNPKKKIFEQIKPYLRTDDNKVAGFKGAAFKVEGKGVCVAPSLADAEVR